MALHERKRREKVGIGKECEIDMAEEFERELCHGMEHVLAEAYKLVDTMGLANESENERRSHDLPFLLSIRLIELGLHRD